MAVGNESRTGEPLVGKKTCFTPNGKNILGICKILTFRELKNVSSETRKNFIAVTKKVQRPETVMFPKR